MLDVKLFNFTDVYSYFIFACVLQKANQ